MSMVCIDRDGVGPDLTAPEADMRGMLSAGGLEIISSGHKHNIITNGEKDAYGNRWRKN